MHGQPKGKGICWKEADGTLKPLDVMAQRKCRAWKLGCMAQVKARSKRKMVFNEVGEARLI